MAMSLCRRCHRGISNPKSIKHGFGPVCWAKLQKMDYNERPTSFRITITDQKEASKSLEKVRELMQHAEVKTCRKCGEPLRPENIEYYDHPGGYDMPGFGQPQWLYHHCEECGFDYSLWKLRIPELAGREQDIETLSTLVDENNPSGRIKTIVPAGRTESTEKEDMCLGDGDCEECEHQDECPVIAEEGSANPDKSIAVAGG